MFVYATRIAILPDRFVRNIQGALSLETVQKVTLV